MKNTFIRLQFGLLALIAILAVACKQEKLAEVLTKDTYPGVSLSLASKLEIGTGSNFTLTGGDLTVPVTITFSSPTNAAFTVNLETKVDTVAKLITAGTLPVGTVAFSPGAAAVVPQINVPAGVSSVTFNVIVSRSVMETNYGSTLAAAIKITSPTKGNVIATGKNALIFVVKTTDVLAANTIHTISFATGSNQFKVPSGTNYEKGSESITVSVPLALQGDAGAEFTVDVATVPDSVTKYINNGTLTNNQVYPTNKISVINPTVKFIAGSNTAILTFTTKIVGLLGVQTAPGAATVKLPTVGFTLKNPSKFQISKTMGTVFVVLDPNFFRPYYGTPFVIKGTVGVASDPIYAAYYDFGGEGIAYHDNTSKDGDGNWRAPDYVDVPGEYTPRSVVGWTSTGEYLTYTVFVEQSGTYEMNMFLGSDNSNGRYTVTMDNQAIMPVSPLGVTSTGSYGNQKPHISTVTLTQGLHIMKAYWDNGSHDWRGVIFTRKS